MADKTIGDLTAATAVTQSDKFVMEQNGEAKSVTGQVLMRDLAKMLDGHGGIKDIQKVESVGYVDTYEITTADGTTYRYSVTNGKDGKDGETGPQGPSGTPTNFLDNSNFNNPVNQRKLDRYSGAGPAIDRWELVGYYPELVLGSSGVSFISGQCRQFVSSEHSIALLGKTVTIAAKINETILVESGVCGKEFIQAIDSAEIPVGTISLEYDANTGEFEFDINSSASSGSPQWAALYLGEYTAENLPDYQYKGYAAELMECWRYYVAPDAVSFDVEILPDAEETESSVSGSVQSMHIALGIPGRVLDKFPLVLDAQGDYTADASMGDEALEAIQKGRQILVRTPNADGGTSTAIYSPVYMYQLPNMENNYLYLFYLRDEKQDLSALLGQPAGTVLMPVYEQLKLLLSETYNESPLEPTE